MKIFNQVAASIKQRRNKNRITKQVKKDVSELSKRFRKDSKNNNIMESIIDNIELHSPSLFAAPATAEQLQAIRAAAISVLIDKNQKEMVAELLKKVAPLPSPKP